MTVQSAIQEIKGTLMIHEITQGEPIELKEPGYGVLTIFKADKPYLEPINLGQKFLIKTGIRLSREIEEPMLQKTRDIARGLTEEHIITDKDLESLNTHMINTRAAIVLLSTMVDRSNKQKSETKKPVNIILSDLLANMDPEASAQLIKWGFDSEINEAIKTATTELNIPTIGVKPAVLGGLLLMGREPREKILQELKKLDRKTQQELIKDIIRNRTHPTGITAGAKLMNISLEKLGINPETITDKIQDTIKHILDLQKNLS